MKYKNVKDFLFGEGYLDGTHSSAEIEQAKKIWQKKRIKHYQKQYKKKHHRKELLFSDDEWKVLMGALKKHNQEPKNMSKFLKACIFSYLNTCFILPDDEAVQSVELEVRRVGVLINQLVRYMHTIQDISTNEFEHLQKLFIQLEGFVYETLRVPNSIEELLNEYVQDDPQILDYLQHLINLKRKEI